MKVFDASVVPVPKDRVVMVIDMEEESPLWEFALWSDEAMMGYDGTLFGGWCVADQETLLWSLDEGAVGGAAQSVLEQPTHWAEVPPVPQAVFHERVAEEEKQLTE